jgi:hypothetical protein
MLVFPTVTNQDGIKYTRSMFDEYLYRYAHRSDGMGNQMQLDDNSVAFFLRRLEQNVGKVFESYTPELTFEKDCVQQYDLDPGAEDVVYTEVDGTGEARIIGGATQDVRLSTVQGAEVKLKTARIASGFSYTEKELDNMILASKTGSPFDIKEHRVKRAVQGLDELAENLGYHGSNEHQIYGLFNDPGVTLANSSFKPYLTAQTANNLYDWFLGLYFDTSINTFERFKPNVCRMTEKLKSKLARTRDSESNATAWTLIRDYFGNDVQFETRTSLRTEILKRHGTLPSNEDKEVLMFYYLSPDTVARKINNIRSKPLEMEGFNYIGRLFYDVSSVMMPYKKAVNFVKYDIATT